MAPRFTVISLTFLVAVLSPHAVCQTTKTAIPAPTVATRLPSASFEKTSLNQTFAYPPITWPESGGPAWNFVGSSGIAWEDSAFAVNNPNAPSGDYVAFIQAQGSFSVSITPLPAGLYRLRFWGAQRLVSGTPNAQTVRVTVASVNVGDIYVGDVTVRSNWADHATSSFVVSSSSPLTIAFIGLATTDQTALLDDIRLEPVTQIPNAGFEDTSISGFSYPPINWPPSAPWTFYGGAGIAKNNSGFTAQNPNAPEGQYVAFLQNNPSSITLPVSVPAPGTYRLRYWGAQRYLGGGPNAQTVRVSVNGFVLAEDLVGKVGSTWIYAEHTTGPFTVSSVTNPVSVKFEGLASDGDDTAFIDDIRLEPVAAWSSTATWGGQAVPTLSDPVTIPINATVAMDATSASAATVHVQGQLLATTDVLASATFSLTTEGVLIYKVRPPSDPSWQTGNLVPLFEVGRPTAPFVQGFTLTLKDIPNVATGSIGPKFLVARDGGEIDLHGIAKKLSWTKLNATLNTGPLTQITLVDAVKQTPSALSDWQSGDEIVIAGSDYQYARPSAGVFPIGSPAHVYQAERFKIVSIDSTGKILNLDYANDYGSGQKATAVQYKHFGGTPLVYTSGTRQWTVDQRAEVGLLTRNVKIQGDAQSEATPNIGGHIMIVGPGIGSPPTIEAGLGRASGVELTRMGQKGMLGRYPWHWHIVQQYGKGQYIKESSIHRSYNRAITIHGTDYAQVESNVAFDHIGHGIFLEDAGEQWNQIKYNLALTTRRPATSDEAVIPSDFRGDERQNRSPATFWITNPLNYVEGNVAAGTEGTGFWLAFPDAVLSPSSGFTYFDGRQPRFNDLGSFKDNVCHCSRSGFDVNDGVASNHDFIANVGWEPTNVAYIQNFLAYCCFDGIYAGDGGTDKVVFKNAVVADCRQCLDLAAPHTVKDSIIVSDTANGLYQLSYVYNVPVANTYYYAPHDGYVIYDGAARLEDSYVVGFTETPQPFWSYSSAIQISGAAARRTNHVFKNVTFNPSSPQIRFADATQGSHGISPVTWGFSIWDETGSIGGSPQWSIINNHPFMHITQTDFPVGNLATSSNVFRSPFKFGHMQIYYAGATLENCPPFNITREQNDGGGYPSATVYINDVAQNWHQSPLIVNNGFRYLLAWDQTPPPVPGKSMTIKMGNLAAGDVTVIKLAGFAFLPYLTVTGAEAEGDVQNLLNAGVTSYAVDTLSDSLWIRVVNTGTSDSVGVSWQ